MKNFSILFIALSIVILLCILFVTLVIKNTNHVIAKKAENRKKKQTTISSKSDEDLDEYEKIGLIVSTLFSIVDGGKKEINKKGIVAVKGKKGLYAKYEISSKENIQWKNKSELDYIPKQFSDQLN
jgi:hypothetical protein